MTQNLTQWTGEDSEQLLRRAFVWDAHAGSYTGPGVNLGFAKAWAQRHVDFISVNVGFDLLAPEATLATAESFHRQASGLADSIVLVDSPDDVLRAREQGKLALAFDIEGANALGGDAGQVEVFRRLGVRQMLLAYNLDNAASGGCHGSGVGLTAFGRDVIREMNRVGMMLDLSHMSERASLEALNETSRPAVFSHSNAKALWNHGRNITAAQMQACASAGGVIGINGIGIFLGNNNASAETYADHVCYTADLVGTKHVGVGMDWGPPLNDAPDLMSTVRANPGYWPPGQSYDLPSIDCMDVARLANVCTQLVHRGWSPADLEDFLGLNFLRVARETWAPAL